MIKAARLLAADGRSNSTIATACKVHRVTMQEWLAKGKQRISELVDSGESEIDEIYEDFLFAVEEGRSEAEGHDLDVIRNPETKNANPWIWHLSKIRPYDWADRIDDAKTDARQVVINIGPATDTKVTETSE
jgi:hypothetical protein